MKCDEETNPPEDRELGHVVIEIGVALTVMVIVMVIYNNIVSNGTYEKGL